MQSVQYQWAKAFLAFTVGALLGAVLVRAGLPVGPLIGLTGLGMGLAVLALEDLYQFLTGGNSVTADIVQHFRR
jgi:hypothetical protein